MFSHILRDCQQGNVIQQTANNTLIGRSKTPKDVKPKTSAREPKTGN